MARAAALPSVVLLLVLLAGCGGGPSSTELTMLAVNDSVGRAVFHLDCGPAGGDVPDAPKACKALEQNPSLVTKPKPWVCLGGTFSWWAVTIVGRLHGKPVFRSFSTCWTTGMATIDRLGLTWAQLRAHLVKRRRVAVLPGTTHTFPPGTLREADLVTCDIRGHHLEQGVPSRGPSSTGYGGAGIVSVTLSVIRRPDGAVRASCHVR
jgi:hypothetical protein